MQAKRIRNIKDGSEYEHLFPQAKLTDKTVKRGATVEDTVKFIPKVVKYTMWQTKELSKELKRNSVPETCKSIWDFIYNHIRYHKDEEGREQIRSPARAWHDRFRGVDCDCYTIFISTILTNLKIPHTLRITRYKQDHFQHIYPIVPTGGGNYITIDGVVEQFNYEEPYTEKKDTNMDLQFLDGIDEPQKAVNIDVQDLMGDDLGALFKKKTPPATNPNQGKGKLKQIITKTLHVTNRINPATVLLRNGILASMKLNVMKVAQRLKWAYLTEANAQKRGIDMNKFTKLKQAKEKLEKIFYGAGGKPENLKSAILTGNGNKNKEVSGVGDMSEGNVFTLNENTPLPQLIGREIYLSENKEDMENFNGFGELGEPVTAATIGAASGVMAAIAGLLKSIGSIIPAKDKASEDFNNPDEKQNASVSMPPSSNPLLPPSTESLPSDGNSTSSVSDEQGSSELPPANDEKKTDDPNKKQGFWEKNKKWLKPTLWTTGGLGALFLGYKLVTKDNINGYPIRMKGGNDSKSDKKPLDGLKGKKKKNDKKKPITLM